MAPITLKLYICGKTHRSDKAVKSALMICEKLSIDASSLTIIDVLEQPDLAEEKKIVATPMLVKETPLPATSFIGDFSRDIQILNKLNVHE